MEVRLLSLSRALDGAQGSTKLNLLLGGNINGGKVGVDSHISAVLVDHHKSSHPAHPSDIDDLSGCHTYDVLSVISAYVHSVIDRDGLINGMDNFTEFFDNPALHRPGQNTFSFLEAGSQTAFIFTLGGFFPFFQLLEQCQELLLSHFKLRHH